MSTDSPGIARSLRVALVQKVLHSLSRDDSAEAEFLVGLLNENLHEIAPHQAHDLIQQVLSIFWDGAVCTLQLLPGLLDTLTSSRSTAAGLSFSI